MRMNFSRQSKMTGVKRQRTFKHYPWRVEFEKRLCLPQPTTVTEQWLKDNRWWWRDAHAAIQRHYANKLSPDDARLLQDSELARWREAELSAFLYELQRRCELGPALAPWPLLSRSKLLALLSRWPNPYTSTSLHMPALIHPFRSKMEWPLEPVSAFRTKSGEPLWNKTEPAWTHPVALAANLAVGDRAILARIKEWLREERTRTGIKSPRGGSVQGLGAKLWRFCEILDRKKVGLQLDESQHSHASKALALWRAVKNPQPRAYDDLKAPTFSPEFFLRVALRDIPKHGKILEKSLPNLDSPER